MTSDECAAQTENSFPQSPIGFVLATVLLGVLLPEMGDVPLTIESFVTAAAIGGLAVLGFGLLFRLMGKLLLGRQAR